MDVKPINITTTSAGVGVKDIIDAKALGRGLPSRTYAGELLEFAVKHKNHFKNALKNAKQKGGAQITANVSITTIDELNSWAKSKRTNRGLLCNFIFEKIIEDGLYHLVFEDDDENQKNGNFSDESNSPYKKNPKD